MRFFNRLGVVSTIVLLVMGASMRPLDASTKKGDKLLAQGRAAEVREKWDEALDLYERALQEDPADAAYQMAVRRARFETGEYHIKAGRALREKGKLDAALAEFRTAYQIDPGSSIAEQELRTTYRLIKEREKERKKGKGAGEEKAVLTPAQKEREESLEQLERLQSVPVLRPIKPVLNRLKISNQTAKVLYETVGKLAGINVIFDPEFQSSGKKVSVDLTNTTLSEALRYLSVLTKTYWKPLSENTIFVTNDNVTKRRDYEDMVVRVFYLKNITKVQELQEIATAVRSVTDIRRVFTYNSQNAILVRGSRDKVLLAEKLLADLDKPLSEVVVDVVVMEANRSRTRDLAASIQSGGKAGINLPISWAPGVVSTTPATTTSGTTPTTTSTTTTTATSRALGALGRISVNDWATTLPGMLLSALMTDRSTKILQRPQVRAADGQKASLRLGDRVPYATGSFQPGVGAVGVSPLVSTQFQFADVGVNVDLTPKIHGEKEVSMHIEIEISSVRERINVGGGLEQPVIGQRRLIEDIRVHDGEVTLLGGLTQDQTTKSQNGVPGVSKIPIIKWLGFNQENKQHTQSELLIALIPHIVRRPELSALNLRGISAGTDQVVRVNLGPEIPAGEEGKTAQPPQPAPAAPAAQPAKPEPAKPEPAKEKPAAPEPAGAIVRFQPAAVKVKQGESFTVSLQLDNATDVYNAPMKFQFDPKILRLQEVTRGAMLSGDGKQVIFTRNILNDSGTASIVLNRLPGAGGVSGSGSLVTLRFQAVAPGVTEVRLPDLIIRDSQMRQIPVSAPALKVEVEQQQGEAAPASPAPSQAESARLSEGFPPPVKPAARGDPLASGAALQSEVGGEARVEESQSGTGGELKASQPERKLYTVQVSANRNLEWARHVYKNMAAKFAVVRMVLAEGDPPLYRILVGNETSYRRAVALSESIRKGFAEIPSVMVRPLLRAGEVVLLSEGGNAPAENETRGAG